MPALPLEPEDDVLVEASRDTSNSKRAEWIDSNIEAVTGALSIASDLLAIGRLQGMKTAFESMRMILKEADAVLTEREKSRSIAALEEERNVI